MMRGNVISETDRSEFFPLKQGSYTFIATTSRVGQFESNINTVRVNAPIYRL